GFALDPTPQDVTLTLAAPDGQAATAFVNTSNAQVAPTETTCGAFRAGTSQDLNQIFYSVSGGTIASSVAPGGFFYFTFVTAPSASFTIDIVQSENHPTFSTLFGVQQQPSTSQVNLFNADCSNSSLGSVSFTGIGQARISVSGATAGQVFIVSVKYQKDNLVGATAPTNPTTVTYRFETQVNGTAVAFDTVDLVLRSPLGAPGAGRGAGAERLTQQLVQPLVAEAMARWRAVGIDQDRLDALRQIDVRIVDLPDAFLGAAATGIIWISPNAAGWGWFIDP